MMKVQTIHRHFGLAACLLAAMAIIGCGKDDSAASPDGTGATATGAGAQGQSQELGGTTDVRYVPPQCLAGAILRFKDVLALEAVQWLPVEVAEAASSKYVGIDLHDVTDILALVLPPNLQQREPPDLGGIVRFSKDYALENLFQGLPTPLPIEKLTLPNGKPGIAISDGGMSVICTLPDPRTMLIGTPGMVQQMIGNEKPDLSSTFVSRMRQLDPSHHVASVVNVQAIPGEAIQELLGELERAPLPEWAGDLVQQAMQLETAEAGINLSGGFNGRVSFTTKDAGAAAKLKDSVMAALTFLRQLALTQARSIASGDPQIDAAIQKYLDRVTKQLVESMSPSLEDNVVTFNTDAAVGASTVGILTALLLPAVSSARHAARTMASQNNLKQISLGLRNYHNVHGEFPVGETETVKHKDGKPLLSWRVHILPYIEQDALYQQFHLDEPWDSPHNIQFADISIPTYTDPRHVLPPGFTTYVAPQGPNSVLGSGVRMRFRDITDGESQVLAVIAVGPDRAIPWTKPDEFRVDPDDIHGSVGVYDDEFLAAMVDGAVYRFDIGILFSDVLLKLIHRNDGAPLPEGTFPFR